MHNAKPSAWDVTWNHVMELAPYRGHLVIACCKVTPPNWLMVYLETNLLDKIGKPLLFSFDNLSTRIWSIWDNVHNWPMVSLFSFPVWNTDVVSVPDHLHLQAFSLVRGSRHKTTLGITVVPALLAWHILGQELMECSDWLTSGVFWLVHQWSVLIGSLVKCSNWFTSGVF